MHQSPNLAGPAFHLTTPVKRAVAPTGLLAILCLVAPATTHEVAAVHADRTRIADATQGPPVAETVVRKAEVRRALEVDQVLLGRRLVLGMEGLEQGAPSHVASVGDQYSGSPVEPVFQAVTDSPERGKLHPAGLDCAAAGHSVALALASHAADHMLQKELKTFLSERHSKVKNKNGMVRRKKSYMSFMRKYYLKTKSRVSRVS